MATKTIYTLNGEPNCVSTAWETKAFSVRSHRWVDPSKDYTSISSGGFFLRSFPFVIEDDTPEEEINIYLTFM